MACSAIVVHEVTGSIPAACRTVGKKWKKKVCLQALNPRLGASAHSVRLPCGPGRPIPQDRKNRRRCLFHDDHNTDKNSSAICRSQFDLLLAPVAKYNQDLISNFKIFYKDYLACTRSKSKRSNQTHDNKHIFRSKTSNVNLYHICFCFVDTPLHRLRRDYESSKTASLFTGQSVWFTTKS